MLKNKKAQSLIEFTMIMVIIIGAFLAIGNYLHRGIQGRWKSAADDLGDQYDPRAANGLVEHRQLINSQTQIYSINDTAGRYTWREDASTVVDTRNGFISVGSY